MSNNQPQDTWVKHADMHSGHVRWIRRENAPVEDKTQSERKDEYNGK